MAEPTQFNVSLVAAGGSGQASNSVDTVIAAAATPVINGNTWTNTGTLNQVGFTAAGGVLEALHASGARSTKVTFHGRVSKVAGVAGDVNVHIYKNGAPMANVLSRSILVDPANPSSEFTMSGVESLSPNDTISVFLENVDDTDDLRLVEGATLSIQS